MTDRELMQMANRIEALAFEMKAPNVYTPRFVMLANEIREAIRARLAQPEPEPYPDDFVDALKYHTAISEQPEPEPVAWMYNGNLHEFDPSDWAVNEVTPLYAAPQQREWQTLTENEIKHLWYEACQTNLELTSQLIVHLARNIEAKLKEKNG